MNTQTLESKRAILEYWTRVEFFSPYLLDSFLNDRQPYQRIYADTPCNLPWAEEGPLAEGDPANLFARGYNLYLGIFSTEESSDRARHVFSEQPSVWQSVNWKQCGSPATQSCFARIAVTKFGAPLLGTLSLSTLPWAHGRLLNGEAASLTMESYWKGVQRLLIDLREEFAETLPPKLVRMPKECMAVLNHQALCTLVQTLFKWAGFSPKDYPIALIEPVFGEEKKLVKEIESERDIPILNSFYIQDLERATISLESQRGTPLDLYLGGKNSERIALESEEGQAAILQTLKPSRLPKGRWPASALHQQPLMQQFAINQIFHSGGLFSVNGPPGTGKTTLLREIVAANMVARGSVLAQFKRANDAFIGRRAIGFGDSDPIFVSNLHPSLLGYEMVVVSSNNTAVQNLSHELPLKKQLDPSYEGASYLEPIAQKLLGLKVGEAWGLISAALGNVENCRHLVDKLFFNEEVRIWDFAEHYKGLSFADARKEFLAIQEKHEALIQEIDALAHLHEEICGGKLETQLETVRQEIKNVRESIAKTEAEWIALQKEELEAEELLQLLVQRSKLWKQERPNIVARISKSKDWSEWSEQSSEYNKGQIAAVEKLHAHKNRSRELRKKIEELQNNAQEKKEEFSKLSTRVSTCKEEYEKLKQIHSDISLPERMLDQKEAYYQNGALNKIRSELFVASMALHEAWLAETLKPKGKFRGNLMAVSHLLQGKNPTTASDTLLAWQSAFLLIPLLSSTFASVQRLFRYLEPQSLGWLFIDEAGQALPQAAVGAIWRAKRVLSIGDPFQIEPISTVAPEIVDGMAKAHIQDHFLAWAPSQISVQNLMDAAAKYGSKRVVREVPYWLGSPLRIHRRCSEPMFSIANEIAYENSMILATTADPSCLLPKSCWHDVVGTVSERQYAPAQGEALVERLFEALNKMNSPDIYVISPFREVIRHIQHLILHHKPLQNLFELKFTNHPLKSWVQEAVGTVHSFQGKQATAVFFVLGADPTTLGSIEWVTRKPNLLNVAVTRACQRFYIIGDYKLWHRWPYFDVAAQKLERVSQQP